MVLNISLEYCSGHKCKDPLVVIPLAQSSLLSPIFRSRPFAGVTHIDTTNHSPKQYVADGAIAIFLRAPIYFLKAFVDGRTPTGQKRKYYTRPRVRNDNYTAIPAY